jgi:hypothetical protein
MSDQVTIKIEDGGMSFVYSDELAPLLEQGASKVTRASHVEPHPSGGGWVADMRPSDGPILGQASSWRPQSDLPLEFLGDVEKEMLRVTVQPFPLREDALAAERAWLAREKGL